MASGDTLEMLNAWDGMPGTGALDSAVLTTYAGGNDEQYQVVDFLINRYMYYYGFMPNHYDGGGITCTISYIPAAESYTTWSIQMIRISASGVLSDFLSTSTNSGSGIAPAGDIAHADVFFTNGPDMHSIGPGQMFQLRINRTGSGTPKLINIHIKET